MDSKISLRIDGKQIFTSKGANLLKTARENGYDIPGLCFHHKLSPTGACRLCLVKVEGTKGLVPSCTISVEDGMNVTAFDDELEQTRKFLLDHFDLEFAFLPFFSDQVCDL